MGLNDQIKRAVTTGKVAVGGKESEKALLLGNVKYLFLSQDLEDQTKERMIYLASVAKVPCKELGYTYRELGEVLGKGHPVGVLAVIDEGKAKIEL